jgi:hypothetical protein
LSSMESCEVGRTTRRLIVIHRQHAVGFAVSTAAGFQASVAE